MFSQEFTGITLFLSLLPSCLEVVRVSLRGLPTSPGCPRLCCDWPEGVHVWRAQSRRSQRHPLLSRHRLRRLLWHFFGEKKGKKNVVCHNYTCTKCIDCPVCTCMCLTCIIVTYGQQKTNLATDTYMYIQDHIYTLHLIIVTYGKIGILGEKRYKRNSLATDTYM